MQTVQPVTLETAQPVALETVQTTGPWTLVSQPVEQAGHFQKNRPSRLKGKKNSACCYLHYLAAHGYRDLSN